MSGMHTIFDTRRLNKDDNCPQADRSAEETASQELAESENASAFLAERGELSSAAKRYLSR